VDVATFRSGQHLIELALREDLGIAGDVTSAVTIVAGQKVKASIMARQAGVIAGLALVVGTYAQVDERVLYRAHVGDGESVRPGDVICEVEGETRSILTGERVALNFLQHLSGVATAARAFVDAVRGTHAVILDTRKTLPGYRLLEKYAVTQGGAQNHRTGLYDMVMIKDNHVESAGSVSEAIRRAQSSPITADLPIVVEVATMAQLEEALQFRVDRILLDNMSDQQMRRAVERTAGRVPLEASGNMTLRRVPAVAATGVDYISVGAITHSAPALDLSMQIEPL